MRWSVEYKGRVYKCGVHQLDGTTWRLMVSGPNITAWQELGCDFGKAQGSYVTLLEFANMREDLREC